jgi:hypothetical protein
VYYYVGTDFQYPQTKGAAVYVRRIKSRKYGDYFQLVRSYRDENGMVKKEVLLHLGKHESPEAAFSAWLSVIEDHRKNDRHDQADKVADKLFKLSSLLERKSIP